MSFRPLPTDYMTWEDEAKREAEGCAAEIKEAAERASLAATLARFILATLLAYMAMAAALFLMGRRVYPLTYEYRRLGHAGACLVLSVLSFLWFLFRVKEPRDELAA